MKSRRCAQLSPSISGRLLSLTMLSRSWTFSTYGLFRQTRKCIVPASDYRRTLLLQNLSINQYRMVKNSKGGLICLQSPADLSLNLQCFITPAYWFPQHHQPHLLRRTTAIHASGEEHQQREWQMHRVVMDFLRLKNMLLPKAAHYLR